MLKVLLVDDEPFIAQGLSVLIDWEKWGYEIAGMVYNGKEFSARKTHMSQDPLLPQTITWNLSATYLFSR